MEDSIMRQALGRIAAIGELYDARRDRFCHMNIFKSAIPPKAVQTVDNQFTDSRYSLSSTLSEKLKSLELSGQLKVSIFGDICGLEGSSKFLKDEKRSERAVRAHLIYNVKTVTDQINIFNDDLRKIINTGVAKYEEATHVVVEINWGANSFLSIEHQNTDNKSHREIQGKFEVMIGKIGFGISGHAKGVHDKSDFASFAECNFHIFADLLPKNEGLSQTLEGYFKLMNQMPELIKNSNNGKGKPLSYGMISLALVQKHIGIEALTDQLMQNIDEQTIMEFENLFSKISDLKQKVNDMYDDIEKHQYCIEQSALNRISEIKTNVELSETRLRCQLAEKIVLFRSRKAGADILQKLIFDYQQDSFSTLNVPKQLNEFNLYREKIDFVKSLESKGVHYIGKNTSLDALLLRYSDKNLYILNYIRHQANKNEEQWAKYRTVFFTFVNKIDDENGPVCIFAEKNLGKEQTSIDETISISNFNNGICISLDIVADSLSQEPSISQPQISKPQAALTPPKEYKEINVLLLGETGVGKSTWINGIEKYMTYPTLEHLEDVGDELNYLITTKFTMTDEDYNEKLITMGTDKNETFMAGQSASQMPTVYVFNTRDTCVRLIDTPGIGDSRGIKQDKENFQNILTMVGKYEEIHGICILLKPNNTRLTVMFQFFIKELLSHLHKDCCKNICFIFTNARSTFYRPGDTLTSLKKLLSDYKDVEIVLAKHTIYCMDNESIRFLAACKHGIKFDESEKENFSQSWKTSVMETNRLIDHIRSLKPHATQQTLCLNASRRMILALTEPLAEIAKNIQENLTLAENKRQEMKRFDKYYIIVLMKKFMVSDDGNIQKPGFIKASEMFVKQIEDRILKLNYEQTEIIKTVSKCDAFLKHNAITPNNDVLDQYLKLCIREENDLTAIGGIKDNLIGVKEMLTNYREEVKTLDEAMAKNEKITLLQPDDISKLLKSLCSLPINGASIKKIMDFELNA